MKKIFNILLLVIIAIVVVATFVSLWKGSRPETIAYETLTVARGNVENVTVATGKILPRDEVAIKPNVTGIIAELHKEAGDYVRAGDIIATLAVVPEMSAVSRAESRVRLAEIALTQGEAEYNRQKRLFAKEIISGQEMEKAELEYQKAVEELQNARDELEITRDGMTSRSTSGNTQVRSTIDGMILDIPVKVGNSVVNTNSFNDGTTIATVANMGDMLFVGKIDETEVGRVQPGMPIQLTVGALREQRFDAELEYIAPKGVEENGAVLFEIKAAARIPDSVTVRAGYSANARIVLSSASDVLVVPESAVQFSGDSTFLYVLESTDGKTPSYKQVPVKIGLSDGIRVEVKEGVDEGTQVRGNQLINK